jgi:hypothetical protein
MHARERYVPLLEDEPAAPTPRRPGAGDPGAIEYASWIRQLQPPPVKSRDAARPNPPVEQSVIDFFCPGSGSPQT